MAMAETMRAMVLDGPGQPLRLRQLPWPVPTAGQILLRVHACAVCRTDLHIVDGELTKPKLPLVLGHQIVGTVVGAGTEAVSVEVGSRVGVPWLGWTCGHCVYCLSGRENLCPQARFTGYTIDGGFAQRATARADFCFPIPETYSDEEAAPLLCAGLIGFRAYRMIGDARRVGFYGFGSAAQILAQLAIAKEGQQAVGQTLRILMLHGVLHLLGYDHQEDAERAEMWAKQEAYAGVRAP